MSETMTAIVGNVIVKSVIILAVLQAAQYFHNPKLLWWWVLALFVDIQYKATVNTKSWKGNANES